ncbi:hypothetical protein BJX99DRAFT_231900 [Aspergillus californicus]
MPKYRATIKYDTVEAYRQHGGQMEQLAKDIFAAKSATEQSPLFSTRSMPPIQWTIIQLPDSVSADELKSVGFPEGVQYEINAA